jgi:uncharacterized membrane protein YeaQ/YmgE (transglycosylase-associated protein family)
MSILMFLVFGFIVGLIARAVMPGDQKMGIGMTTALGVAGSFVGGFLGSLFTNARVLDFSTAGLIGSVIGAFAVLFLVGMAGRRGVAV